MSFHLGYWHVAMMASELLWKKCGGHFLAPAWHAMMPTACYTRKPRLLTMTIFFNYMRISFPVWKADLAAALQTVKDVSKLNALKNLRDIMCYYIPAIQDYLLCLKDRDFSALYKMWYHMFRMMCIFNCKNYVYPMMCHSLYLEWLQQNNHPIFDFLKQNLETTDEEKGETSFAGLRTTTVNDTDKAPLDRLNSSYSLLHLTSEIEQEFAMELYGETCFDLYLSVCVWIYA
jgi:hypothetical protein